MKFYIKISLVNVTKSTVFCGFGRIYGRSSTVNRKLHFLCSESEQILDNFQYFIESGLVLQYYSERSQPSKMESLIIFTKKSILDIWESSEYVSEYAKPFLYFSIDLLN